MLQHLTNLCYVLIIFKNTVRTTTHIFLNLNAIRIEISLLPTCLGDALLLF